MTKLSRALPLAIVLGTTSVTAQAAAIPGGFSSLLVFGDSLSDTGNLFLATGGTFPPPPYNNGRFTGGNTYVDELQSDWALTPGLDLFNFAFGGALATTNGDTIPDFATQIGLFQLSGAPVGPDPLTIVNFGGNDIIAATVAAGGSAGLGISGIAGDLSNPVAVAAAEAALETIARQAADDVAAGISALAATNPGSDTFLLFNSTDVSAAPRFAQPDAFGINPDTGLSNGAFASLATSIFNDQLGLNAGLLNAQGINVVLADANSQFEAVIANPVDFGLSDGTSACGTLAGIVSGTGIFDFSDDTCDETDIASITVPFWDDLHPNTSLHRVFADLGAATLSAAVPLPAPLAMMVGGLMLLAGLKRRTRT